jgi:filamentous hemagglutinin family protein
MNNSYKLVYSETLNTWVAVAEHVSARGKKSAVRLVTAAAIMAGGALGTGWALAAPPLIATPAVNQLPTGAQVATGTVNISQTQTATAANMAIQQSSNQAIVNWQSFNVGANAKVNITQPSSTSVLLNRVMDSNPSQIFGQVNANGQVFLSNPNGVYFAPGSSVDVGSFTATTHSISDADFLAGKYNFNRNGATGSIANEGSIASGLGGYIALLAPEVRNQGVVVAKVGGTVAMAAGESYQLQFNSNNQLTNVLVTPSALDTLIENGNAVQAPGGLIILSAQAASSLLGGVVKNSGSISATGLVNDGGTIRLSASNKIELTSTSSISADAAPNNAGNGGRIDIITDLNNATGITKVDGSISAKGGELGGDGGFVDTSAARLAIGESTLVTTGASKGKAGTWLLDPYDVTIGPDPTISGTTYANSFTAGTTSTILASSISSSLNAGSNVSISTGSDSANTIYVNSAITATTGTATLTLTGGTINLAANISTVGSQTYSGAVVINNASGITLSSTNSNINFGSTVNSSTGNYYGLTVSNGTGTTAFGGVVGATNALGYLCINVVSCSATSVGTASSSGTTTLAGNVTTSGTQTYGGNLTLGANTSLTSTANGGNGAVTIAGNVDSLSTISSGILKFLGSGYWAISTSSGSTWAYYLAGSNGSNTYQSTVSLGNVNYTSTLSALSSLPTISYGSGAYAWTPALSTTISLLVVGGGGSGGESVFIGGGGGGGGGGVIFANSYTASNQVAITVGAGGAAINNANGYVGNSGQSSTFGSLTALGGGGGGIFWNSGVAGYALAGGSGGGGMGTNVSNGINLGAAAGGSTTVGTYYANAGGNGLVDGLYFAGGGGGAGSAGGNATSTQSGAGGSGYASNITGTTAYYGAGGGGSAGNTTDTTKIGLGGSGVGGNGSVGQSATTLLATSGVTNTGSGGGGSVSGGIGGSAANKPSGAGGSGIVVLNGNIVNAPSSYSLNINSGTGKAVIGGSVANVSTLTINSDSSLSEIAGAISGSTALTKSGTAGVLTLAANNTYSGGTTISAGTLQVGAGGTSGAIAGNIVNNATLAFNRSDDLSYADVISGTGALSKLGAGALTLSGTNTYTGSTTISAGTLKAASAAALGTGAVSIDASGTLDLTFGGTVALGSSLSMSTGASITNSANTSSLTVAGTSTLVGNINTAGNQTYTGAVTLSGNTTLTTLNTSQANTNGTITFDAAVDGTASGAQSLTVTSGTGAVSFGSSVGGTTPLSSLTITGGSTSTGQTTTLGGNVTTSGNQSFGGNLTLGANTSLTSTANSGNGLVTIAGNITTALPSTTTTGVLLQFLGNGYWEMSTNGGSTWAYYSSTDSSSTYQASGTNGGVSFTSTATAFLNTPNITYTLGTYSLSPDTVANVNYLVLGGGGGGGYWQAGGGGGGGVVTGSASLSSCTSCYAIVVGSGGAGGTGNTFVAAGGATGGSSSITGNSLNISALGGGGGGASTVNATTGASGGGAGRYSSTAGTHTGTQGSNGGAFQTAGSTGVGGGGGGGAADNWTNNGGNGGAGVANPISGSNIGQLSGGSYYVAGGGGGSTEVGLPGTGGLGGGGAGGINYPNLTPRIDGRSGTANTGGGGGGTYNSTSGGSALGGNGGDGGSGAVVLSNFSFLGTKYYALTINSGTSKASIGGSVSNVTTLTINSTSALSEITGAVGGSTALVKSGAGGVLTLSGANTYTGGTTISAGTLKIGHATALGGSGGAVSVTDDAALDLNGTSMTNTNTLTLRGSGISGGGALTNSGNTAATYAGNIVLGSASSIGSAVGDITASGVVSGAFALTKVAAATLALNGSNTYTGGTTISAGTLKIGHSNALGSSLGGAISVASLAALDLNGFGLSNTSTLTLNGSGISSGGALTNSSTGTAISNPIVLASDASIGSSTGNINLSGVISGTGNLTKIGSAHSTLSGSNTYTGTTTVSGSGILSISNSQGLGSTDGGTIVSSTGRLLFNGLSIGAEAITLNGGSLEVQSGTSSLSGTVNLAADSTIRVDLGAQLTLSGVVSGTGRLTKNFITGGSPVNFGTLILTATNTHSGGTTISAGTLQLGAGGTTGTIAGDVTNNATLAFNRSDDLTFAGIISGTGAVTKLAANTLTFSGTNTYTGGTTISAGTLQIGAGSNIGSITGDVTNNATLTFNRSDALNFSGAISGTGAVTKLGTGTTTLSGINTYTGSTTVSTGTLAISNAAGLGDTAAGTTVANGATLDLQGVVVGAEALTLNGGTLSTSTGTSSLAGTVTLGDNSTANVAGTQLSLSGVVSGVGYGLTKTGSGSLVLSGNNNYSGATTVSAGMLAITHASGLGATSGGTTVASDATLDLRGAAVGAEAITLSGGTLAATTGTSSLSGAVNLTSASSLSGAGALTLSGAITSNGNGLALIGTGAKTLSNTSNTLSTIATGSGVGALSVVNNAALAIGQVTSGSSTYSGINSTGTVSVTTRTGDLTVSQNVVTTSTATSYTTPALKLGAGSLAAAGTPTGGDVLLSGTPTISVGTGGVALIYSGYATTSAARALANSFAPKLSYYSINSDSTYVPTSFAAAYFSLFRESPTTLYTLYVPGQTFTYGTPITSLNYCYSTSASSCAPVTATGVPSTTQAQAFNNLLLDAGTYPGTIAPAPLEITGYFFAAGNAVNIVVNPKAVNIVNVASTSTYDGLSTYANVANAMTYNVSGLVGSDTVRSITQTPSNSVVAGNVANAGNFAVTPSAAVLSIGRASNYTFNYTSALATVSKANLTVKVKDDAKFVGESDNAAYDGVSYSGFVAGQTASVLSGAVAISRSNASVNAAGAYSGVLSAASSTLSSSNYNITYAPGNYTIIPADQLLIRLADTSTTYGTAPSYNLTSVQYKRSTGGAVVDLTSRAAVNTSAFTLADGAGGNTALTLGPLSSSLSSAGQVAVGSYQVGASSITNTSANYSNTVNIVGSLSVGQKSLTVAATSGLSKTYDGTTNMTSLGLGLTGLVGADAVTASGLGTYANANAGNNKSFDVSGISLSGADAANYKIASNTLSATTGVITAAPLLITANNDSKTYDAAAYTTANAATVGVRYSGFINGETSSDLSGTLIYSGTAIGAVNVGNYVIEPTGQTSSNYAITYSNGALSISPADVRVSATNVALTGTVGKVYDGTNVATLTSNNYVTTGWQGSDGATITQTAGTYDNANAGTNKLVNVTLASSDYSATNGTLLSNYNLPTSASGYVGVITPKTVTVTNASRSTTYDGMTSYNTLAAGTTYTVGAMVGSDAVSSISQTASGFGGGASGTAQGGAFTVTPGAALLGTGSASNYNFSYVGSTHTVDKVNLSVAANNATKTYDGAVYSGGNGVTYNGFVNNETSAALGGSLSYAGTSQTAKNVGSYVITPNGVTSANYNVSFVDGTLTINPAALNAVVASLTGSTSKVYDGSTAAMLTSSNFLLSGFATGEGASVSKTSGTFDDANAGTNKTVTVSLSSSDFAGNSGTLLSNYTLPTVASGAIGTISKAPLSAALTGSTAKVYDANTAATLSANNLAWTGFVAGEGASVSKTTGTFDNANSGANKTVTVTLSSSDIVSNSGTLLTNYTLPTSASGSIGTISPASLTLTASTNTKNFDGKTDAQAVPTANGLIGSDTVTNLSEAYADSNPGTGKKLNVQSGYQISDGNQGRNYSVTLVPDQTGEIRAQAVAVLPPQAPNASNNSSAPPTLTLFAVSTTATPASSASSSSSASASSVSIGSSSGVVVNTISSATTQVNGFVTVLVPSGTAIAGTGLVIALPEQVLTSNAASTSVQVTLPNNEPLPSWIRYDAVTQTLVTTAVPTGAFPLSVVVTVDGKSTIIQISESKTNP